MIRISSSKFDYKCPEVVYIIGSGPSLSATHQKIPDDAYRVYLNGAVNIKDSKPDIWFCHCQTVPKNKWWKDTYKKYQKISMLGNFITDMGYISKYYFDFYNDLPKYKVIVGTTVAGIAMQLFPFFGAKKIIIAGVDMQGKHRFDGSYNPENNESKERDQINRINYFIENNSCAYKSLGPTRFKIPEVEK